MCARVALGWVEPNTLFFTLFRVASVDPLFSIPLPVGHAADLVFIFKRAVLVRASICACFYVSVLLSDAAFGRRDAPGRRLAGGCLGGAFGAPLEGAFGAALPPSRRRLASSNGL